MLAHTILSNNFGDGIFGNLKWERKGYCGWYLDLEYLDLVSHSILVIVRCTKEKTGDFQVHLWNRLLVASERIAVVLPYQINNVSSGVLESTPWQIGK